MTEDTKDVVCYYHEPLKAPLLRAAVLPAIQRATAAGVDVSLERHWLHGPHIRIHLVGTPAIVAAISAAVADELSNYLRSRPSEAKLSPPVLLAQAAAAGLAELIPPPYEPIWPDNTVLIEDFGGAAHANLLNSPTAQVRAHLLGAGLPAISQTLAHLNRHGDTSSSRVYAAMTAMIMHAGCFPSGLDDGYLSFRSHLEDYLHRNDPQGTARAQHAAAWNRHATDILTLVGRYRAAETRALPEQAEAWRQWSTSAWRTVEAAHDHGQIVFPSMVEMERRAQVLGEQALQDRLAPAGQGRGISVFHRMFRDALTADRSEQFERRYAIYRFCTNMLYLLLATCDVSAGERYLAASLVCDAVEHLSGQTWRHRLAPAGRSPIHRAAADVPGASRS